VISIRTLLRSSAGDFIPLEDLPATSGDAFYVEGAIELRIDHKPIMGVREWDDVNHLWGYIGNMIDELRNSPTVETYFPSQPIHLSFQRDDNFIVVTCGDRRASAPADELLIAIRDEGIRFWNAMLKLAPDNAAEYKFQIEQLRASATER
jgi:hypothetical protein